MYRKVILSLLAILSLGISVNIYTDLRGYGHGLFKWADIVFPLDLSLMAGTWKEDSFVLYNLPDGLWILALCLVLIMVWDSVDKSQVVRWLILGLTMAYALEVFQYFGFVAGTFDAVDIMVYTIVCLCTTIIYLLQKPQQWKIGNYIFFHS